MAKKTEIIINLREIMKIYKDMQVAREQAIKAERITEMKKTCVPCWRGGEI